MRRRGTDKNEKSENRRELSWLRRGVFLGAWERAVNARGRHGFYPVVSGELLKGFKIIGVVLCADLSGNKNRIEDRMKTEDH